MAELHVQRKEGNIWPWIIGGLVVLALLFWFLMGRDDGVAVSDANDTDSTLVATAPAVDAMDGDMQAANGGAVAQYLQFVDARASRASGVAHDYTADGLRQLAAALGEVVNRDSAGGVAVQPRVTEIRERADAIQQEPASSEHALLVREAFTLVSSLIGQMNSSGANSAAGNTQNLQDAAMAIEPSRPLLDQTNAVEDFFAQAADAIRDMS